MPRMCQAPGCPQLACGKASIEDVSFDLCLQHLRTVEQARESIHEQLRQYEPGAKCSVPDCLTSATAQLQFGPEWMNVCDSHRIKLTETISILRNGKPPALRPLKTYFQQAPSVRVVEDP